MLTDTQVTQEHWLRLILLMITLPPIKAAQGLTAAANGFIAVNKYSPWLPCCRLLLRVHTVTLLLINTTHGYVMKIKATNGYSAAEQYYS